jgi:pyridoxal phosphate enzyme (YggS family)
MNGIPDRLDQVRDRIRAAAAACGRDPGEITLLAVSKTKPAEDIRSAFAAGQRAFGENYLQDAMGKIRTLEDLPIEWHFIGRVQGNKTADIARHFAWVHGLDRLRHAELLSRHRDTGQPDLQVCIQVNLSGEASKGGVEPDEVAALARQVTDLPRLHLRGLMTMPAPDSGTAEQRANFAALRRLLERLQADGLRVDTLSMGMSGDMEAAIAEGATIVRIGTDIFGARQ